MKVVRRKIELMGTDSAQFALLSNINLWSSVIGVFTTLLIGVFSMLAAVLVGLTWSHNRQKKKAEEAVEDILKLKKSMDNIYKSYLSLTSEAYELIKSIHRLAIKAKEGSQEIESLKLKAKNKGADENEIAKQIKNKESAFDQILNKLTAASKVQTKPLEEFLSDVSRRRIIDKALELRLKQLTGK